ncbi:hypothetical protein M9458_008240, partial [Cirrhinus mrigala]
VVSARPAAPGRLSLRGLRQVYGVLSERYGVSVSFTQLQEEVEMEAQQKNPEPDGSELHLALSETPMERDGGSQQQDEPQEPRYAGMTISRLVQEDDSQLSEEEEEKETENNISGTQEEETQISSPH